MSQFHIESDAHLNRVVNNFFHSYSAGDYGVSDLNVLKSFTSYILQQRDLPKYKVAMMFICLNQPYWEFIGKAISGAKQFFLPDHNVDYFLWSDIPTKDTKEYLDSLNKLPTQKEIEENILKSVITEVQYPDARMRPTISPNQFLSREAVINGVSEARAIKDLIIFPTEPIEWPYPTLFRYHMFLQQEEALKDYDYVFYCDADMVFANMVGDEILGDGLTAARHPMYALRENLNPPTEPNPESTAFIKRPGMYAVKNGQNFFQPMYYAGGFQGGKTKDFFTAAKEMKKNIDIDLDSKKYVARWNDESHWNKYLFDNPPAKVLSPAYIYPDSMIKEYYEPIWGRSFNPKLITLTKKFSLAKLTPEQVAANNMSAIK